MTTELTVKFIDDHGEHITSVTASARTFKTGSRGFGHYGKIVIDGKKYQVSMSIVEVGSKPQQ